MVHRNGERQADRLLSSGTLPQAILRREVALELERILGSKHFRGSKRAQLLLRHVVDNAFEGLPDRLKERTIGVELFGRNADYDTGQDAIVRVAANDVRKRLAEYYGGEPQSGQTGAVRISLPAGCYVPEFHPSEHPPVEPEPGAQAARPASGKRALVFAAIVLLAAAFGVFLFFRWRGAGTDVLDDFWRPVLASERAALICVAQPMAYRVLSEQEERFPDEEPRPTLPTLPDTGTIPRRELIPMADAFIGAGDGAALAHVASLFGARGKPWQLRVGNDTSSADLRSAPAVLIGAYTNPWTRNLTRNLRFVFEPQSIIRDRRRPGRFWSIPDKTPDWKTPEDYGIVSRVLSGETGEPVVVVAGLTNAGTRAAGELVTSAKLLAAAAKQLPPEWKGRSVQLVLHTRMIGKTPGPPEVVAAHAW